MQFLGMFRHARTAHAQGLTKEMFVSLGQSAVSARDVYAQGGLIVFAEGEIRNRRALEKKFRLSEDAPMSLIAAKAYRMWGADYPRHIEGAAVTAVIDRAEDRMLLSADRAGAIGVYYSWRGRSAAFASHPELLLKMGAAGRKIGREGLMEMFAFGGCFSPGKTPYQDIRMLESGCVLVADSRGMRIKRYFPLIKSLASTENAPFSLEDFLKELKDRELALLISDGCSRRMAELLKDDERCLFFHEREGGDDSAREASLVLGKPVEETEASAEEVLSLLKECVSATGFPGAGIGDAYLAHVLKEALCVLKCAIAGGLGAVRAAEIQEGNLLRFLRKDIYKKTDASGYVRDRLNELLDRMRIPYHEEGMEMRALQLLRAQTTASQYLARLRMLAGWAGGRAVSPLADERFLASVLCPENKTAHCPAVKCTEKCAELIIQEALDTAYDDAQPVSVLVDPKAVRAEAQMEKADLCALSRLIQINSFLYQYDAEISVV